MDELRGRRVLLTPFKKDRPKSNYRGPPKKRAEVTGYSECTVRRIIAENLEYSGAKFTSPPKW